MAPLRVSTTKSEWLPDDPTAFVPTRLWKLPFITTWDDSRNQNRPTDSAEEAVFQRRAAVSLRLRLELHHVPVQEPKAQHGAPQKDRRSHGLRGREEYRPPEGR